MSIRGFSPVRELLGVALVALSAGVGYAQQWDPKPTKDIDAGGDKKRTPIVFVHGNSGSGDNFEKVAQHFTSNGYPVTWITAFDWSTATPAGGGRGAHGARGGAPGAGGGAARGESTPAAPPVARGPAPGGPPAATTVALDKFIDEVRKRTGFDKVNLIGHSAGSFQTNTYLSDATRASKIAHWATVGGVGASNPNGVASIAISGVGDNGRGPSATNGGKVAWMPDWQDHTMMSTSDEVFWALFSFFNDGEKPKTLKITPEAEPLVAGVIETYINNIPCPNTKVEVWEVAKETGRRMKDKPLISFTTNEKGEWGPFKADPKQNYEFAVYEKNLIRTPKRVYREPFKHTDNLFVIRIASDKEGYTASPVDAAPKFLTKKSGVYSVRHQNGALLPGIVSVKVNGTEIVDPIVTRGTRPNQPTTVAIYLADGNENGTSEVAAIADPAFQRAFVTSCDMCLPADANKSIKFEMNNRVLNVPAWSADEAGLVNVVFDDYR